MARGDFYISLSGFGSHEIKNAAKKTFRFTELICEEINSHGFSLRVWIEKSETTRKNQVTPYLEFSLGTLKHKLFSNRLTHFSFETHTPFLVPEDCKLYVQLTPALKMKEFSSRLHCELV
jgi:hypothetical protein